MYLLFLSVNPQDTENFYQFGSHWHAAHFGFGCAGYDYESNQVYHDCDQNCGQHTDRRAFCDGEQAIINNPGYNTHDGSGDQWFYIRVFELIAEVQVLADRKVIQYTHAKGEQNSRKDDSINVCLWENCKDQRQNDKIHPKGNCRIVQGFLLLSDRLQYTVGNGGQCRKDN